MLGGTEGSNCHDSPHIRWQQFEDHVSGGSQRRSRGVGGAGKDGEVAEEGNGPDDVVTRRPRRVLSLAGFLTKSNRYLHFPILHRAPHRPARQPVTTAPQTYPHYPVSAARPRWLDRFPLFRPVPVLARRHLFDRQAIRLARAAGVRNRTRPS